MAQIRTTVRTEIIEHDGQRFVTERELPPIHGPWPARAPLRFEVVPE